MRKILVFLLSATLALPAFTQRLELLPRAGFVVPHHDYMNHYIDGHVTGIAGAALWETDGSKDWHHYFNFPHWGFTLQHDRLPTDTLGNSTSLFFHNVLPLDRQRKVELGLGIGANYFSQPFDLEENPKNNAIGSHVNCALQIYLGWRIPVSRKLELKPKVSISHASNGAFQAPNLGVNVAALSLSIGFRTDTSRVPARLKPEFDKTPVWMAGFLAGAKEYAPPGSGRFAVVSALVQRLSRISGKSSLGIAADVSYNAGHYSELEKADDEPSSRLSTLRLGLGGVWMLHFGKISLATTIGAYPYTRFPRDGRIFNRYTLIYDLNGNLTINAGLKSHFANADHVEVGMYYKW